MAGGNSYLVAPHRGENLKLSFSGWREFIFSGRLGRNSFLVAGPEGIQIYWLEGIKIQWPA